MTPEETAELVEEAVSMAGVVLQTLQELTTPPKAAMALYAALGQVAAMNRHYPDAQFAFKDLMQNFEGLFVTAFELQRESHPKGYDA